MMRNAYPERDQVSTSYVAAIESLQDSAAVSMPKPGSGVGRERRKEWCWGMAPTWIWNHENLFSEAIQIVQISIRPQHL